MRLIRAVKNRFGPTDEVGVFEMGESGLAGIDNPSKLLLAERVKDVPGSVVSVVLEGTRPMLVEIQALVISTSLTIPRRVATGGRFCPVADVGGSTCETGGVTSGRPGYIYKCYRWCEVGRPGYRFGYLFGGGFEFLNKFIAADVAAVGEVGLLGEVRKVGGWRRG